MPHKEAIGQDYAESDTARRRDMNGYLTVEKNPISRSGVFQYMGRSIGAPEPDKIYNVYRPPEELEDAEAIASFRGLPIIDDHEMLGDGFTPPEDKGMHGVTGDDAEFRDGILYSTLKIFSQTLQSMIEQGKKDLSLGYRCIYEKVSGAINGQPYEYVQRSLRGNHLALVDEARCNVSVLDHTWAYDSFDLTGNTKGLDMADDDKKPETGDKELTLAEVHKFLKEHAPMWKELQTMMGSDDEEDGEEDLDTAVDGDTKEKDGDTKAEDEDEKKKEDEKKEEKGMDAAEFKKAIFREVAQRDALVNQLKPLIGVFDSADKTLDEVAAYGIAKLKIEAPKGQELVALDGFLKGHKLAAGATKNVVVTLDSKRPTKQSSEVDGYINSTAN